MFQSDLSMKNKTTIHYMDKYRASAYYAYRSCLFMGAFCAHVNCKGDLNPVAIYFMHYELYALATPSAIIPLTPTWYS